MFSSDECVVCLDSPPSQVFHPCQHLCTCLKCCMQIQAARLHCPLCRQDIVSVSVVIDSALLPTTKELETFDREEYLVLLRKTQTKDAGFVGKSKLARSVAREFGDEYEQRVKENAGGDRCMGTKYKFEVRDNLKVEFKVGRRTIREEYPLVEDWKSTLAENLAGDKISVLDVAIHYPEIYMMVKHLGHMEEMKEVIGEGKKKR